MSAAPRPVVGTIPELVHRAAREFGDAPFVLRAGGGNSGAYDFRAASTAVRAFAALLRERGVRPGERVVLQSENRPEWGLAYLGILEAGAVVVPLDTQLREADAGEILAACRATHAVASGSRIAMLSRAATARLPGLALVSLDGGDGTPGMDEVRRRPVGDSPGPPLRGPDDVAALLFTSGTTGRPKGAMLTHANLLHNVEAIVEVFHFGPRDRFLSVLPLHHAFECTAGFLSPLRVGASIAYARSLKSQELLEDLRSAGATILLGVPLLHEKLLAGIERGIQKAEGARGAAMRAALAASRTIGRSTGLRLAPLVLAPVRRRAGLERIRIMVSGAARLAPSIYRGFEDLGIPMLEGYGLTECSPVVSANRPERRGVGSVGWPLPGVEVSIDAPDLEGDGEIVVRGPNVMLGYHEDPEATAEVLRADGFHTGDLGRRLADGRIRITGRRKSLIVTAAGKKIYPEEIEARLSASPYVVEVLVQGGAGARDEREEVLAHVFPDFEALRQLARERGREADDGFVQETLDREAETLGMGLAPFKRVRRVIVRSTPFERTATGKIRRDL